MTTSTPRFTIIVPTYNGQDYIQTCIESVLQQTFTDFELVILEDGSTDNTLSIIKGYRDKRIKIFESPVNLGIVANWRRALSIGKGEFMTYFGQDDGMLPNYLEVMDCLIRQEPSASLYHAHFQFVDVDGKVLSTSRPMPRKENVSEYIAALFSRNRDTHGSGYILRSALYDELGGIVPYPNLFFADDVLWISSMLPSYKACATEVCFFCRQHMSLSAQPQHWRAWLDAMEEYVTFLFELAKTNADFDIALRNNAGNYFYSSILMIYLNALYNATMSNHKLDPVIEQKLQRILAVIPGSLALRGRFDIRIRKTINANPILRNLFLAHKRLTHK